MWSTVDVQLPFADSSATFLTREVGISRVHIWFWYAGWLRHPVLLLLVDSQCVVVSLTVERVL